MWPSQFDRFKNNSDNREKYNLNKKTRRHLFSSIKTITY
jgi:hypothetical protein